MRARKNSTRQGAGCVDPRFSAPPGNKDVKRKCELEKGEPASQLQARGKTRSAGYGSSWKLDLGESRKTQVFL